MDDLPGKFPGFQHDVWVHTTRLPSAFFSELLPLVDDLAELKLLLFCFWALPQKEGKFRYLRCGDFTANDEFMRGLAATGADSTAVLDAALAKAVKDGALLAAEVAGEMDKETLYFVNTPGGRAAVEQITKSEYLAGDLDHPIELLPERPNIYKLYEENIGPLSPMIADELKDAEKEFPATWIEDAFREAVKSNKRNLRYIRAILERWRADGRMAIRVERDEEDGKRYVTGPYADFIDH
jgi:DnaD/phage-associated family protein